MKTVRTLVPFFLKSWLKYKSLSFILQTLKPRRLLHDHGRRFKCYDNCTCRPYCVDTDKKTNLTQVYSCVVNVVTPWSVPTSSASLSEWTGVWGFFSGRPSFSWLQDTTDDAVTSWGNTQTQRLWWSNAPLKDPHTVAPQLNNRHYWKI